MARQRSSRGAGPLIQRALRRPAQDRFDEKYMPEPMSGCWLWMGTLSKKGELYGLFCYERRAQRAHRASYKMHVGPVDDAIQDLHRCDNPACVNPDHLFLGTHADNMADKSRKGRAPKPNAALSKEQVSEIRESLLPDSQLAKLFGVNRKHIWALQNTNKYWQ